MEKYYYSLGEVILGFRAEYRKNAQELKELKKHIEVMDRRIQKFDFIMTQEGTDQETVKLLFRFLEYRNKLEQRTNILTEKLGLNKNNTALEKTLSVEKNEDNYYGVEGSKRIVITNNELFREQVDKIKQSEFVEQMPNLLFTIGAKGTEEVLEFDISQIKFHQNKNGRLITGLQYDATKDTLCYKAGQEYWTDEKTSLMDTLYEITVPKLHLSEYQQGLIEESIDRGQSIETGRENTEGIYTFNDQKEGEVVLAKLRK